MTLFSYINTNIDTIKYQMKIGIVPCSILKHWQMYCRYNYYSRLGNSKENAVVFVCNDFQVARSWVFTIIKKMESEI